MATVLQPVSRSRCVQRSFARRSEGAPVPAWRERAASALTGVGSTAVALLLVQLATEVLPSVTVLTYLSTTRLLVVVGLIALLARDALLGRRPGSLRLSRPAAGVVTAGAAFVLWHVIAALAVPPEAYTALRLLVEQALAGALVVLLVRSHDDVVGVLWTVALSVTVVSVRAVQQFVDHENTTHFLYQVDGVARGLHASQVPDDALIRVVGNFNDPNVFAAFLVLLLPLAIHLLVRVRAPLWVRVVGVALGGAALLLTFSRGAVIGLLLAGLVLVVRRRPWVGAMLGALIPVAVLNPLSSGRLLSAVAPRLRVWERAATVALEHPLTGVGSGGFRAYAPEFFNAHNLFLQLAAEGGLLAAALMGALLGCGVVAALRIAERGGPHGGLGAAVAVALLAFVWISLLDDPYNAKAVSSAVWLLLGLVVALDAQRTARTTASGADDATQELAIVPAQVEAPAG